MNNQLFLSIFNLTIAPQEASLLTTRGSRLLLLHRTMPPLKYDGQEKWYTPNGFFLSRPEEIVISRRLLPDSCKMRTVGGWKGIGNKNYEIVIPTV